MQLRAARRRGSDADAWGGGGDRSEPDRRSNRERIDDMFGGGSSRGGSRGGMGGGAGRGGGAKEERGGLRAA